VLTGIKSNSKESFDGPVYG
jgi:hypothetical protein